MGKRKKAVTSSKPAAAGNTISTKSNKGEKKKAKGSKPALNKPALAWKKHVSMEEEIQKCMDQLTDLILTEVSKAEYGNLLNDYAKSEFILIDGDSLFILCTSELSLQHGQNLHLFYLVECLLLDLTNKGVNYMIVFFKVRTREAFMFDMMPQGSLKTSIQMNIVNITDAEHVYYQTPDFLSLRTALIVHLIKNTEVAIHSEFSNCFDGRWQEFLNKNRPRCLIIADEGLNRQQTIFLHIFIIDTLSKRISIFLTSGQESDTIGICGFHVHGSKSHQQFLQQTQATIDQHLKHWADAGTKILLSHAGCSDLTALEAKLHKKTFAFLKEKKDIRYIVCIVSCSWILEMYDRILQSQTTGAELKTLAWQEAVDLIRMYCLSVVFLHHLPLSQRVQVRLTNYRWSERTYRFILQHKFCEFLVLKHLANQTSLNTDVSALPDLSDNLLWKSIAHYYEVQEDPELDLNRRSDICRDYEHLWNDITTTLSGIYDTGTAFPLRTTCLCFLIESSRSEEKMTVPEQALIPMTCTVLDEFAGDVLKALPFLKGDEPALTFLRKRRGTNERPCWHSRRPHSDDLGQNGGAIDLSILQSYQELQTSPHLYGQIDDLGSKPIAHDPQKSSTDVKKSKTNPMTKKERIIWDNQKRKRAKEIQQKEESQWNDLFTSFEKEIKQNFNSAISSLDSFLKICQDKSVKCAIEMAGLNAYIERWKEHCKDKGNTHKNLNIAVEVMRRIHSLIGNYLDLLKENDYLQIVKCLRYLGFDNLVATSEYTKIPRNKREELKRKLSTYVVGMGSARFQLQYMSQYLKQEERSDPDPRVHFIPDKWQRKILDIVDKNESAVIIAPPASGKKYASYYCMEKILRESDEGVVVYVAPTQALVTEAWTSVHSRFSKTLPTGFALCGVFTKAYRQNALNCQILVTMPQCLELLILSPHHQEWVKKMRYVIFDEVCYHGLDSTAEIWEHLLLLVQCPFLVLSAVIQNPEHIAKWLQSVKRYWKHTKVLVTENSGSSNGAKEIQSKDNAKEENKSCKVQLVVHKGRPNDLERYVCSLKGSDITVEHYHPYAALTIEQIEKYDIPEDLYLSPRETVMLYDTMVKVRSDWHRARELDPEEFICFKDHAVITKADVRLYEEELKEELKSWIECNHKQEAGTVLKVLNPHSTLCSETQMKDAFPHFIEKLQEMDKLPALCFVFNVRQVKELAEIMCRFLEEKQRNKQITGSKKEEQLLAKKETKTGKPVKIQQTVDMKQSLQGDRTLVWDTESENITQLLAKISEVPSDCTYANYEAVAMKVLRKILDHAELKTQHKQLQKLALRGIGYHYGFMEYKAKHFVEMLFRMGLIQVVTATGTLGLGINVPCKSVVFVQNATFLDTVNYRWMARRAGQRGQHLLGNVYFLNIPLPKIANLMISEVPKFQGQFPLRISSILKLMLFASAAEDKIDARAKVLSVLKNSLLAFEQPWTLKVLKLYFVFSLQFLVKEGYMDQNGNAMGFSRLVAQLHHYEPSNFIFVSFVVKGMFHRICQPMQKGSKYFSQNVMEQLLLVLAHLFGRKHLPATIVKAKQRFSHSEVILEDLPEDFAAALAKYNRNAEENFGQFLKSVSRLVNMPDRFRLPLSKVDFSNKPHDSQLTFDMGCDQARTAISPFVCLSGNTDFDLLHTGTANHVLLHLLGMTAAHIPLLHSKKSDNYGRKVPLNGYALDFYKHGSLVTVVQENGLHEGEAYRLLKEFAFTIRTISVSLHELCHSDDRNVVWAFEQLSWSFWKKLEKIQL